MKINVCSETLLFNIKGDGVDRAFVDCLELLNESENINVVVNSEGKGDVMHSHTYGPYYFWRGLKYKGKKVYTAHVVPSTVEGSVVGWKFLMPFFNWYLKKVYSYADVCIAISPMVKNAILKLGVKTKIVSMYNPISIDKWKRTNELRKKGREILGIADDEFCVLGVGQVQNRKGCSDFIEIGKQIPEAKFRWIGGTPMGIFNEGTTSLKKQIASAPSNIKFSGLFDMNDMQALYAAGDLFLFPSYQENCPYAPLEAAASGMPVIFRELLDYKLLYTNDFLKAKNNSQFVLHVKKLMADKIEYKKGLEISEKLVTQFDKNKIKEELISVYKDLVNNVN